MNKFNSLKLRIVIIIVSACFFSVLLFQSCKKTGFNEAVLHELNFENNFFAIKSPLNDDVLKVIELLKAENLKTGFVNKLPKYCGLPVWNKILITRQPAENYSAIPYNRASHGPSSSFENEEDSLSTIIIPLTNNNQNLSSLIIVKENEDSSFVIDCYTANQYLYDLCHSPIINIAEAENLLGLFFFMEMNTWGTTKFYHVPLPLFADMKSELLSDGTKAVEIAPVPGGGGITPNSFVFVCWLQQGEVCTCANPSNCDWATGCSTCSIVHCGPIGGGTGGGTGGGGIVNTGGGGTGTGGSGGGTSGGGCPSSPISWYMLNALPGGGGCGNTPPPIITTLVTALNLNITQTNWLINNLIRAEEIVNYLEIGGTPERIQNSKDHLNLMMLNNSYLAFVATHALAGNATIIWWEDGIWLDNIGHTMGEDIFNFYMDVSKPKNKKPQEFTAICDGVSFITIASGNDKKERSGFVTLDGKFIFTTIGDGLNVPISIRIRNNQAYYNYKTNLGAPALSYSGMFIDNVRNEYWIPIRTNLHTHVPDFGNNGVSITTNAAKSDEDEDIAFQIQNNLSTQFNLFVIEVKDNGKYLTANYSKNSPNYQIMGNDLLIADICADIN